MFAGLYVPFCVTSIILDKCRITVNMKQIDLKITDRFENKSQKTICMTSVETNAWHNICMPVALRA